MLSRPRPTRPRRAEDSTPVPNAMSTKNPKVPSRDFSKRPPAPIGTYVPSGVTSSRKPTEPTVVGKKPARLASTEKPPHITSQMKTKLAAARSEQMVLAAKESAKAVHIPKKSSKRRLSPPSDDSIVSPTSATDLDNWPLPNAPPNDSVMGSFGDMQNRRQKHKQMTVTEPNQEEDDASILVPASNATWQAIMEEVHSDSDADSFTTASDPNVAEHGDIQIGMARTGLQMQGDDEAVRPPPLRTARYKSAADSGIVPLPGPPMAVQKLGAPDRESRCASLVTLNDSRSAGLLFQASGVDRKVRFPEQKVLMQITGQPARKPKVPSKDEYKALVARGMREFQEYAAKQDKRVPEKARVSDKPPAPKKPQVPQKPARTPKFKPPPKLQARPKAQPLPISKPSPKPEVAKDVGLKQSLKGALGAFKKRTSKVLSLESTPGPKRRSLAVLMQPQSVRQSVEDISAQVAVGRGRSMKRDSRRDGRAKLQKSQTTARSASSSPRTSRIFKRSSGAVKTSTLQVSTLDRMPSLPAVAELEGEGPYYELAAFDHDGNIPRDRSKSPIRVWNNGGATWLAAHKRMNETSSTLALVPGVGVGSRHRDWAEEYRSVIA